MAKFMQVSRSAARTVLFILGLVIGSPAGPALSQIATDGTVGPATSLSGPDFTISSSLGTQTGANLFHSFQTFHIQTGESATFTGPGGPGSINTTISRVTGRQESFINGLLRSTIPDADLWFLNPAGVMFGENLEIDPGPHGFVALLKGRDICFTFKGHADGIETFDQHVLVRLGNIKRVRLTAGTGDMLMRQVDHKSCLSV